MKLPPIIYKCKPLYSKKSRLRKLCLRQSWLSQFWLSQFCYRQLCWLKLCQGELSHRKIYKLGMAIHLVIIGFISALICWWVLAHTQLHLCLTPSLDGARVLLFYKTPPQEIKRGNIVYIRGHDYKYLGPQPYAKRVVGLSGDSIIKEKNTIRIGGRIFQLIDNTSEGQSLTPITQDHVPQGYFFVAGDHPRSIDSRYEEFGLVPVGKVWGKGIAKW